MALRRSGAALVALFALGCGSIAPPLEAADPAPFEALGTGAGRGYKPFHGIQHAHVAENGDDGMGTLAEAYTYGRDKANLDFMGISSHAHLIDDTGYAALKTAAAKFTQPGKFVALVAQEWSTISSGGHVNIIEANARCNVADGDWIGFYEKWLPAHPEVGFVQFNHPHPDNPKEFGGDVFSPIGQSLPARTARNRVVGMALVNGPGKYEGDDMKGRPDQWDLGHNGKNYEDEYKEFLNKGWRIGPIGDADNHVPNWGRACPTRTGVWAKALTKSDVVDAFRSRRIFASWDDNVALWLSIGGKPMGSELTIKGDLPVEVVVTDPDTDIDRLELHGDADGVGGKQAIVLATHSVNGRKARWTLTLPAPKGEAYYFAKVVYKGDTAWAWSSPVWMHR